MPAPAGSLFDRVPGSSLGNAVDWLTGTLLGSVATILCVLAIALVGVMMLTGRLPIRHAAKVVIGCFLLLGAPIVAMTFTSVWQQQVPARPPPAIVEQVDPRGDLPPSDYDPYAGASLRRD
ncbi:TrbC/VirB2 family protein [Pelagerythrobacter sp.]|uniref:TrbC/VirB2 family protein n=1 Tax=Pelagerythrobacter sp. TaxID=2800702 RepID=UPI0035ADC172